MLQTSVLGGAASAIILTASANAVAVQEHVFRLITEASSGNDKLVHGSPVSAKNWPALVTMITGREYLDGREVITRCSGSLIGPGVLLTAAHCIHSNAPNFQNPKLGFGSDTTVDLSCVVPTAYLASSRTAPPKSRQDFALCTFTAPAGAELPLFEVIDAESTLENNDAVLLTGFGCRAMQFSAGIWTPIAESGKPVLTVGDSAISGTSVLGGAFDDEFVTILSNVTEAAKEPALCPGDSGGPLMSGSTVKEQTVKRRVRGVNSWLRGYPGTSSYLRSGIAPTGGSDFRTFLDEWTPANPGMNICGFRGFLPANVCRQ